MPDCKFCGAANEAQAERCSGCGAWISEAGAAPRAGEARPAADGAEGFEQRVLRVLASEGKIAAIKIYRERTGLGLKESKDAVEALAAAHGVAPASGGGCAGVVLLMVATAAALTIAIALVA